MRPQSISPHTDQRRERTTSRLEFPHPLDLIKQRLQLVVVNLDEAIMRSVVTPEREVNGNAPRDDALRLFRVGRAEVRDLRGLKLREGGLASKSRADGHGRIRRVELGERTHVVQGLVPHPSNLVSTARHEDKRVSLTRCRGARGPRWSQAGP
jgi:hypothetical protein